MDAQMIRHDAYYRAYLPAMTALYERLSTKAVARRFRENAQALMKVGLAMDADKAANGGKTTDWTLADTWDHKEDLSGVLASILRDRGVEICQECLLEGGWHEKDCRSGMADRIQATLKK